MTADAAEPWFDGSTVQRVVKPLDGQGRSVAACWTRVLIADPVDPHASRSYELLRVVQVLTIWVSRPMTVLGRWGQLVVRHPAWRRAFVTSGTAIFFASAAVALGGVVLGFSGFKP